MSNEMKAGLAAAIPCVLAISLLIALKVHRDAQPTAPLIPPFQGEPATKPVDFDLVGTWQVTRFVVPGKPSAPGGFWSVQWNLEKIEDGSWRDTNGQGVFVLTNLAATPQLLCWSGSPHGRRWFSINEQSFGFLMMTGDDGERYMAVRRD